MKYCLGIDVGGTTVKIGLFTKEGELCVKYEIPTRTENDGEAILPDIANSIKKTLEERHIAQHEVIGLGIGVPAPIDEEGVITIKTANLGWKYKEVRRELEERTGFSVKTANDANMAALGEMWLGAGKGKKDLILITLGTGVGGGIIINGKLLSGHAGSGGEIGHICVNYGETQTCGCGKKGCLEQYASATGIARLARKVLKSSTEESTMRGQTVITAKEVFDGVKAGDKLAKEVAEQFGFYMGAALANLAVVTGPSLILIGGGVSKAGPIVMDYIRKYYDRYAFFANHDVEFNMATLGNDAGICGGARLVLDV